VVAQFVLMACVLVAGALPPGWPGGLTGALRGAAAALAVVGVVLALWAGRTMGRSLTPFPHPVQAGLVTTGPFALVRHPIYTGGLALFLGFALVTSVTALVLTAVLGLLWAAKLRFEERLLEDVYEDYAAYQQRVRWRLVPLVY